MSDERLRELERLARAGDADTRAALIRSLQRAGDQPALCELGEHQPAAASVPQKRILDDDGLPLLRLWHTTCLTCHVAIPVQWVEVESPWWAYDQTEFMVQARHFLKIDDVT